jgi:hypothetical protein
MLISQSSCSSLIAEIGVPSAFDRAIRYSVSQHQRSTFDRAVAGLVTDFLRYPVVREVFGPKVECKSVARLCDWLRVLLRLEESGSTKRMRGRTVGFVTPHMGTATKKGKP